MRQTRASKCFDKTFRKEKDLYLVHLPANYTSCMWKSPVTEKTTLCQRKINFKKPQHMTIKSVLTCLKRRGKKVLYLIINQCLPLHHSPCWARKQFFGHKLPCLFSPGILTVPGRKKQPAQICMEEHIDRRGNTSLWLARCSCKLAMLQNKVLLQRMALACEAENSDGSTIKDCEECLYASFLNPKELPTIPSLLITDM